MAALTRAKVAVDLSFRSTTSWLAKCSHHHHPPTDIVVRSSSSSYPCNHHPTNHVIMSGHRRRWSSTSAASSQPMSNDDNDSNTTVKKVKPSYPKVDALFEKISKLSMDEFQLLSHLVIHHLGFTLYEQELRPPEKPLESTTNTSEAQEAAAAAAPAKTKFDIKLLGYNDAAKIKVIKEVRAIAGLGLKEAKEFVESVPKVLMKDISDEQAQELKQKLEAVGAQVEIA